jgi:hypothetical protein
MTAQAYRSEARSRSIVSAAQIDETRRGRLPDKIKAALLAAKRIAVSDPARGATVGTHFNEGDRNARHQRSGLAENRLCRRRIETMRLVNGTVAPISASRNRARSCKASPDALAGPSRKRLALSTDFSL